mgnify:CR=1 FL=1
MYHHAECGNETELRQALFESMGFIITVGSGFHVGHNSCYRRCARHYMVVSGIPMNLA